MLHEIEKRRRNIDAHPYIVQIKGKNNKLLFAFVEDYKKTLETLITDQIVSLPEKIDWLIQCAKAVKMLHDIPVRSVSILLVF